VPLFEAVSVSNADSLFLVLEYMGGGVLMKVQLGAVRDSVQAPFEIDQTREYFRQLCLGLEYLHANGVIHRDVGFSGWLSLNMADRAAGETG
jgi:[calcium/calmodulin-dependent protein kinase] kinase